MIMLGASGIDACLIWSYARLPPMSPPVAYSIVPIPLGQAREANLSLAELRLRHLSATFPNRGESYYNTI
jgi:hypothetical protein